MKRNFFREMCLIFFAVLFMIFPAGCTNDAGAPTDNVSSSNTGSQSATEPVSTTESMSDEEKKLLAVDKIYENMTLKERVCQLVIARNPAKEKLNILEEVLREYPLGGVCLFKYDFDGKNADAVKDKIASYQAMVQTPLFVCVDEEGGSVVRISSNKELRESKFESPRQLFRKGGMEAIRIDTAEKAEFLKYFGINLNFAPVADVATEKNALLYNRSFGIGTKETAEYVKSVVTVMKEQKMGSCIKHFPGYGNSSGDTHKGLVYDESNLKELEETSLPPFAAGFSAGADSVMVTHTIIRSIDIKNPASMSPSVMQYIRGPMGFDGVVITDGLDMQAVLDYCGGNDPALMSVLAGADIALTPQDAAASCEALLKAAQEGVLTQERLEKSVKRILQMKRNLDIVPSPES